MNTEELLALVGVWITRGDSLESGAMPTAAAATRLCADELAPIASALCAEVEALRKDADRYAVIKKMAVFRWKYADGSFRFDTPVLAEREMTFDECIDFWIERAAKETK